MARWQGWSGESIEHLVLREGPAGVVAESALLVSGDDAFAARYRISCDGSWQVRKAEVSLIGKERKLELASDGAGNWSDGSTALPELKGAVDIDISAPPFTNTLPIRRLGLQAGQSKDILVAYVRLPDLAVTAEPQRYTRIEERRYRFEWVGTGFVSDIEVDGCGLVTTYPGLFKRVGVNA